MDQQLLETLQRRKVLSVDETADILGVSITAVRRWVGAGKLPSFKAMERRLIRSDTILAAYLEHHLNGHPWSIALALVRDHQVMGVERVGRNELAAELLQSDLNSTALDIVGTAQTAIENVS